jgi:hypothetical protein
MCLVRDTKPAACFLYTARSACVYKFKFQPNFYEICILSILRTVPYVAKKEANGLDEKLYI